MSDGEIVDTTTAPGTEDDHDLTKGAEAYAPNVTGQMASGGGPALLGASGMPATPGAVAAPASPASTLGAGAGDALKKFSAGMAAKPAVVPIAPLPAAHVEAFHTIFGATPPTPAAPAMTPAPAPVAIPLAATPPPIAPMAPMTMPQMSDARAKHLISPAGRSVWAFLDALGRL